MQLCGQEFSPTLIARINCTAQTEPMLSRRELSRRVCRWLDWSAPNGKLKDASARVALQRLDQRGLIALPPAARPPPRRCAEPRAEPCVPEPPAVCLELRALGAIELVPITEPRSELSRVWRALMQRYHPHGDGPLCGAQLRYLIHSEHYAWLGGLAFSAAAWRLGARDRYIGWSEAARGAHLQQVVANSRLLIAPQVRVKHLASHVLGRCARRLRADWVARYGYEPVLLESYVEQQRYRGTCYRAANWRRVGCTTGRGRQDRERRAALPVKDVYLYPLVRNWRARLCREPLTRPVRRADAADWAGEEFGAARLGDARLQRRLVVLARDFYARPQAQLPHACTSLPKTRAAYRFFDHERVTMQALLSPHHEATAARVAEHPVVLAVQDSTSLNYSAHPATEGLGPLNTTRDHSVGLWMHDTLAFTPEGVPLGLLDVQCWARDPAKQGQRATRHTRRIADKESMKWLNSFARACTLQARCPDTTVVSVGDRESDIYELLVRANAPGAAKLLIRAERTRRMTAEHGALWTYMAQQPLAGERVLELPRRGARASRQAQLEIRFAHVELKAPKRKAHLPRLKLWAVWAHEVGAGPEVAEPLDWMLLSTVPVESYAQACERLDWYRARWSIEVYHRTVKSGCRIKERQLASAKRLEACLAIDMVVAWRIFHLVKLGRETPQVPCTVYFEEPQWRALVAKVKREARPSEPPSLREAMRMVATLGGFLGRKSDGEPGTKSLWLGLQRLDDLTDMWVYLTQEFGIKMPAVSSKHDYG